jgi:hypothetical protein
LLLPFKQQLESDNGYLCANQWSAFDSVRFGIAINGAVSPVIGGFTSGTPIVPNTGRVPTTLVVNVPLAGAVRTVTALWRGVRGSTVIIDSPATLTALLD